MVDLVLVLVLSPNTAVLYAVPAAESAALCARAFLS